MRNPSSEAKTLSRDARAMKSIAPHPVRREISAGVIVFRRTVEGPKFLVLYHGNTYWNFPKGKIESEERALEAALRETREETGISERDLRLIRPFKAYERFSFSQRGQKFFKVVILYLAETRNARVRITHKHQGYGWFVFHEAKRILGNYEKSQEALKQAYDFLRRESARRHSAHSQGNNPRI